MPSSPNGHRAERECGCPPWVLRCAHFGEETLWLTGPFQGTYGVHGPAPGPVAMHCRYCFNGGESLPAAEAEFHRRAEELRAIDA